MVNGGTDGWLRSRAKSALDLGIQHLAQLTSREHISPCLDAFFQAIILIHRCADLIDHDPTGIKAALGETQLPTTDADWFPYPSKLVSSFPSAPTSRLNYTVLSAGFHRQSPQTSTFERIVAHVYLRAEGGKVPRYCSVV
jgi:hypothetical protein